MTATKCSQSSKAFERCLRYGVSASVVDPLLSLLFDLHHLQERVIDHLIFLGVQPESLPEPFCHRERNKSNYASKISMNTVSDTKPSAASMFTSSDVNTANIVNVTNNDGSGDNADVNNNKLGKKENIFVNKEVYQNRSCTTKTSHITNECEISTKEKIVEKEDIIKEPEEEQWCELEQSKLEYWHNASTLYQMLLECKLTDCRKGNKTDKIEAAEECNSITGDISVKRTEKETHEECSSLKRRACYMLACFLATAHNYHYKWEYKPILQLITKSRKDSIRCDNCLDVNKRNKKREREQLEEYQEEEKKKNKFEQMVSSAVVEEEKLVSNREKHDSHSKKEQEEQKNNTAEIYLDTNDNAISLLKIDELSEEELKYVLHWWREYEQWIRCMVTDQQETLHAICAKKLSETISVHAKWVEVDCDAVEEHKSNVKDEFNQDSMSQRRSPAVQLPLISGVLQNYEELILVNDAFATCQRNVQSALVHLEEAIETCLDESVTVNEYERSYWQNMSRFEAECNAWQQLLLTLHSLRQLMKKELKGKRKEKSKIESSQN